MKTLLNSFLLAILIAGFSNMNDLQAKKLDIFDFEVTKCSNDYPYEIASRKWEAPAGSISLTNKLFTERNNCFWVRIKYNHSILPNDQLFIKVKPNVELISIFVDDLQVFNAVNLFVDASQKPIPFDWRVINIAQKQYAKYVYVKVKVPDVSNNYVFSEIKIDDSIDVVIEAFKIDFFNSLIGLMLLFISVITFYQLPVYFKNRKFTSFWFGLTCLSAGIYLLSYANTVRYFIDNYYVWRNLSVFAVVSFPVGFFAYYSAQIKGVIGNIIGWFWKIHIVFALFFILLSAIGAITLYAVYVSKYFMIILVFSFSAFMVLSVWAIVKQKYRQPILFVSSLILFLSIILDLAGYYGLLPLGFGFSALGMLIFISFELFLQIKHYNATNRKIETYSIELQYKSIELENALDKFEKINKTLEKKVEERTHILNEKNKLLNDLNTILSESEIKYHQLADTLLEGIIIHQNGIIIEANNEMNNILGCKSNTLAGSKVINFVSPAHQHIVENILNFSIKEAVEIEMMKQDGGYIRVEVVGKEIEFASNIKGVLAVKNISENKKTAEALHKSEERLSAIFSNAAVGLVVIDKDGRYMKYNNKWMRMLKYTETEMKQRHYHDIVYSSDRLSAKSESGDTNFAHYERRFVRKDGSYFWGEVWPSVLRGKNNEVNGIIEIIIDVTDRKKAEEELKQTENKYRQLFERAPVGIFSSMFNNRFVDANPEMAKILGYAKDKKLVGNENIIMQQITENPTNKAKLRNAAKNQNEISNFEFELIKDDGKKIWLSVNIRVLQDYSGEYKINGYAYDITRQKDAERYQKMLSGAIAKSSLLLIITDYKGCIDYISPGLCEKFNIAAEIVHHKHISTIWKKDNQKLKMTFNDVFADDGGETEISVSDGQNLVRLFVYVYPLKENNRFISQYVVHFEETLRYSNFDDTLISSERILAQIASKTRFKAVYVDSALKIIYVSQAFAALFGTTNHFMHGKSIYSFINSKQVSEGIEGALNGKETEIEHLINNDITGGLTYTFHSIPQHDQNGNVVALFIYTYSHDTAMKQQFNIESNEIDLLKIIHCGILLIKNKTISWVNNYICTLSGFSADRLINRDMNLLFEISSSEIKDILKSETDTKTVYMKCADGTTKTTRLYWQPTDKNNEMIVSATVIDKEIELKNEVAKLQKIHNKEKEQKNILLRNISYEMRTPLNVIIGFSDIIDTQMLEPSQLSFIEAIKGAARNLLGIINDIVDISQIEAGNLNFTHKAIRLESLMLQLKTSLKDYFKGRPISVEYRISDTIPDFILLDEYRLKQVLLSIIGHSMRYTDRPEMSFAIMNFNTTKKNTDIRIKALNHGKFIGADKFRNYEVTNETPLYDQQKTGLSSLGISLAKEIVNALNGTLSISYENGLIIITIDIPDVKIAKVLDKTKTLSLDFKIDTKKIEFEPATILLVEDLKANIILITEILQKTNINVDVCRNGRNTFDYLKEKTPDLILMDIMLPDVDGIEITEKIKNSEQEDLRNVPVIVFTATIISQRINKLKKAGFDGYLQKPINHKEFYTELMRFLPYKYIADKKNSQDFTEQVYTKSEWMKQGNVREVRRFLESELIHEWQIVSINQRIKEIGEFGNRLKEVADKHNVPLLASYSENLFHHINRLEFEELMDVLGTFPDILLKLKAMTTN